MPGWTRVPASPQGVVNNASRRSNDNSAASRGRNLTSTDDEVFYTFSVNETAATDDWQGYRGGYVVDHLVSWVVEADEDIKVAPEKALKRLHNLEKQPRNELSILRCSLVVTSNSIDILDNQTGDLCEQFSLDLVDTPFSSTCDPGEHIYNNVLMFYVLQEQYDEMTPCELHVFQVLGCPARDIAMSIDQRKHRRRATPSSRKSLVPDSRPKGASPGGMAPSSRNEPMPNGSSHSGRQDYRRQDVNPVSKLTPPSQQQQQQPVARRPQSLPQSLQQTQPPMAREPTVHPLASVTGTPGLQIENYVMLLNRAFDDIEQFTWSLEQTSQRLRAASGRQRDSLGALRMQAPPPEHYMDILQKFKLSLNLLALLRLELHNPNAAELVHFLFAPLEFIIATAPGQEEYAASVDVPFLLPETVNFLRDCLTSREVNLWVSLGPAWNLTSDQWDLPASPPIYHPRFYDGWEPPSSWLQALNAVSSSEARPQQPAADSAYRPRAANGNAEPAADRQQRRASARTSRAVERSRDNADQSGYGARDWSEDMSQSQMPRDDDLRPAAPRHSLPALPASATSSPKLRRVRPGANGGGDGSRWDEQAGPLQQQQQQQSQPWAATPGFGGYGTQQWTSADAQQQTMPARAAGAIRISPPSRGSSNGGDRQSMAVRSAPQQSLNDAIQQQQQQPLLGPKPNVTRDDAVQQPKLPGNAPPQQHQSAAMARQRFIADLLASGAKICEVTIDLRANNHKELSVQRGDVVEILDDARKWWLCKNMAGEEGYVPFTALQKYQPSSRNGDASGEPSPTSRAAIPAAATFVPPPPPPGPPPPIPTQNPAGFAQGLRLPAKPAQHKVSNQQERTRHNFDSELKVQLAEFRKGNWGLSERALRASLSTITPSSSAKDLAKWLDIRGFTEQTKYELRSLSAQDLFSMNEEELVRKLGSEDGSRMASLLESMPTSTTYDRSGSAASKASSSQRLAQPNRLNADDLPIDY